jgi:hypothetical protein
MKNNAQAIPVTELPAKAQNVDGIFQFLFNLFDLLTVIVNFFDALRNLLTGEDGES